mmetsp:Transcript_46987/g.135371  ORF Transcript_46987/g.135371 Transcript_46987/m.135371 type:complete len:260 (-) Transcript_46987:38-817(-)
MPYICRPITTTVAALLLDSAGGLSRAHEAGVDGEVPYLLVGNVPRGASERRRPLMRTEQLAAIGPEDDGSDVRHAHGEEASSAVLGENVAWRQAPTHGGAVAALEMAHDQGSAATTHPTHHGAQIKVLPFNLASFVGLARVFGDIAHHWTTLSLTGDGRSAAGELAASPRYGGVVVPSPWARAALPVALAVVAAAVILRSGGAAAAWPWHAGKDEDAPAKPLHTFDAGAAFSERSVRLVTGRAPCRTQAASRTGDGAPT